MPSGIGKAIAASITRSEKIQTRPTAVEDVAQTHGHFFKLKPLDRLNKGS
jgi:hypothetical protein